MATIVQRLPLRLLSHPCNDSHELSRHPIQFSDQLDSSRCSSNELGCCDGSFNANQGILAAVPLKVREVIKELEKAGWRQVRAKGDHQTFRWQNYCGIGPT